MCNISHPARRGLSIVGLLVTMVCIVVLFSILMTSMNSAITGQGTQQGGTVRSFEDKMYLMALYQSMAVHANENKEAYLIPSEFSGSRDVTQNTTANLFSAMLMKQFTVPKQLISGNEYNNSVSVIEEYDYTAYNPAARVFWDTAFQADLRNVSNVSFAHMPLCGERCTKQWRATMDSSVPLIGNRGPKDGVNSTMSLACGQDGVWRGHVVFGDGHIDFLEAPTIANRLVKENGVSQPDNIFKMESGANGSDAILSFTRVMSRQGPELQFD